MTVSQSEDGVSASSLLIGSLKSLFYELTISIKQKCLGPLNIED